MRRSVTRIPVILLLLAGVLIAVSAPVVLAEAYLSRVDIYGRETGSYARLPDEPLPQMPREQSLALTARSLFQPYQVFASGSPMDVVAIGDFNHDGLEDIAAAPDQQGKLTILRQTSTGELAAAERYPLLSSPESIAVGDFNHDGYSDLVIAGYDSGLYFYLQDEAGALVIQPKVTGGDGPDAMVTADLNHDGRDDLAVSNWRSNFISVFYQQADGSIGLETRYPAIAAGWDDIDAGDLNQDGLTDVVKMNGQGLNPTLDVYFQTSGGMLSDPIPVTMTPPVGYFTTGNGLAVGDITGDGKMDVAVSDGGNRPYSKMMVFNFAAGIPASQEATYNAYDCLESVEIADVNLDGRQDVIAVNGGWNALSVFTQAQDGTLEPYTLYGLPYASHYTPQGLDIGDLNHDGYPDVAIADYNHGVVVLYHENRPDFEISPSPNTFPVAVGGIASFEVALNSYYGYNQPVHLSVGNLPPGVSYSFSENPSTPPGAVTLLFSIADTAPLGAFGITVNGFSDGVIHSASIGLEIIKPVKTLIATAQEPFWFGSPIYFSAEAEGSNLTFVWDFGDGTYGYGNPISHMYRALGVFTAHVYAYNPVSSLVSEVTIEVVDRPIEGLNIRSQIPIFAHLPTQLGAYISAGTNPVFEWDFGDGGQASGSQVTHVFPASGQYNVRVKVTNGSGEQTAEAVVSVVKPFELWFPRIASDH